MKKLLQLLQYIRDHKSYLDKDTTIQLLNLVIDDIKIGGEEAAVISKFGKNALDLVNGIKSADFAVTSHAYDNL